MDGYTVPPQWKVGAGIAFISYSLFAVYIVGVLDGKIAPTFFVIAIGGLAIAVGAQAWYKRSGRVVKLRKLAEANNMTYRADAKFDGRDGIVFSTGDDRMFKDILTANDHPFAELGNFQFSTGSGKNRTQHVRGFVRIKLPRKLPHMFLDARAGSSLNYSGGGVDKAGELSKSQRIELEGDFDTYFALYAPEDYGVDARYVFTPDVMQALIEAAHQYDCEIIDDDFYLLAGGGIPLDDQNALEEIIAIIGHLRPELVQQTQYYSDDRVDSRATGAIAQQGVRLKYKKFSTATIVITAIVIIYVLITFLSSASGR